MHKIYLFIFDMLVTLIMQITGAPNYANFEGKLF